MVQCGLLDSICANISLLSDAVGILMEKRTLLILFGY
jgi:hypothetical protein